MKKFQIATLVGIFALSTLAIRGASPTQPGKQAFNRGDANVDGNIDMTDAITILSWYSLGMPPALPCNDAADVNSDNCVDPSDAAFLLNFLFQGGQQPRAPFTFSGPNCGCDPDYGSGVLGIDFVGCTSYPVCSGPNC